MIRRKSIKHIKEVKNFYDKGLKIYSPDGRRLIFTGEPGFSIDYQELLREKKRKIRYKDKRRVS